MRVFAVSALFLFGGQIEAQAGFIEDLFGAFGGGQQRAAEAPPPRPAAKSKARGYHSSLGYLPQASHPKRRAVARAVADDKVAGAGPVKKGFCHEQASQSADSGETEALLHDATLRAGDTIVTGEGLRVYEGGGGCPHKPEDFLALANSRDVKGSKRSSLLAIESALKTRLDAGQARGVLFSSKERKEVSR